MNLLHLSDSNGNGKIEIFEKEMHGKEVLLDRVFPLVRPTGQLAYVSK